MAESRGRTAVAALLSFNGGFVDTVGFLGLQGLFVAHVTGNFVTLGAALVLGSHGILNKVLALPFIAVIALARLAGGVARRHGWPVLRIMLTTEVILLAAFFGLAVAFGPFADADRPLALLTGFAGIAAMALQNALQRVHLASLPPTTLMTGSTTQATLDAVDLLAGTIPGEAATVRARLSRLRRALCFSQRAAPRRRCSTGSWDSGVSPSPSSSARPRRSCAWMNQSSTRSRLTDAAPDQQFRQMFGMGPNGSAGCRLASSSFRTAGGRVPCVGWRCPTGACGIAVPPAGAVEGGVWPAGALPCSCAEAATLTSIKTGIVIVIARMGVTFREPICHCNRQPCCRFPRVRCNTILGKIVGPSPAGGTNPAITR
jgi:uncharacterized membrane protein YoaK (UPF0700 family)